MGPMELPCRLTSLHSVPTFSRIVKCPSDFQLMKKVAFVHEKCQLQNGYFDGKR